MNKPVAFITGASRGIGRGIAIELARNGYDLAGNARTFDPHNTQTGLFEVNERVKEAGGAFLPLQGDVASLDDHERMLGSIVEKYGRIDLLVNNAGVAPEKRLDILETSSGSFDRVLGINLRGPFFVAERRPAVRLEEMAQEEIELPRQLLDVERHAVRDVVR